MGMEAEHLKEAIVDAVEQTVETLEGKTPEEVNEADLGI